MFEDLIPEPAITLALLARRMDRIGIVFKYEDAEKLFKMYDNEILVLCVKVPMCRYCISCAEASSFFDDTFWRG